MGGGAREAGGSQRSRTLGKDLLPWGGSLAQRCTPGEQKCLHWSPWLWLCWEEADSYSLPSQKTYFCFELSTLSCPLKLQSLRQITSYFPVFLPLSLPCWHGAAAAGEHYRCAGWEQPWLCSSPCSTPTLLPWGHCGDGQQHQE